MKKVFFITILFAASFILRAQSDKVDQLQALEKNQSDNQNKSTIAKLKSSSRLFAGKDDLTSVILIIPADSLVTVLDSDSTYFHVVFDENEGYIFKRDAVLVKNAVYSVPNNTTQAIPQDTQTEQDQQQNRFSFLENKYGTNMAARLMAGKIWKGMNSDMVNDSWGTPKKINRVINGNIVNEEWIFNNTWLYFENSTLMDWGPVKR
jgi:hypothetical protein